MKRRSFIVGSSGLIACPSIITYANSDDSNQLKQIVQKQEDERKDILSFEIENEVIHESIHISHHTEKVVEHNKIRINVKMCFGDGKYYQLMEQNALENFGQPIDIDNGSLEAKRLHDGKLQTFFGEWDPKLENWQLTRIFDEKVVEEFTFDDVYKKSLLMQNLIKPIEVDEIYTDLSDFKFNLKKCPLFNTEYDTALSPQHYFDFCVNKTHFYKFNENEVPVLSAHAKMHGNEIVQIAISKKHVNIQGLSYPFPSAISDYVLSMDNEIQATASYATGTIKHLKLNQPLLETSTYEFPDWKIKKDESGNPQVIGIEKLENIEDIYI